MVRACAWVRIRPCCHLGDLKHLHTIRLLISKIFDEVFVSSKFEKFSPPLKLIKDESSEDYSPMLALYCVLKSFDHSVFIIPADMPFFDPKSLGELAKFKDEFEMVVAGDDEHIPLALWLFLVQA